MRGLAFTWIAVVGILIATPALVCSPAFACIGANHPSTKIAAIDAALPASTATTSELAEAKELREKAYALAMAGKLSEAHAAANLALTILGVEWTPQPAGKPSRC